MTIGHEHRSSSRTCSHDRTSRPISSWSVDACSESQLSTRILSLFLEAVPIITLAFCRNFMPHITVSDQGDGKTFKRVNQSPMRPVALDDSVTDWVLGISHVHGRPTLDVQFTNFAYRQFANYYHARCPQNGQTWVTGYDIMLIASYICAAHVYRANLV